MLCHSMAHPLFASRAHYTRSAGTKVTDKSVTPWSAAGSKGVAATATALTGANCCGSCTAKLQGATVHC